jgi:hypothetical protein
VKEKFFPGAARSLQLGEGPPSLKNIAGAGDAE